MGFGAMGVLISVMSNEVMDKQLLVECGLCPQKLKKTERLVRALAKDTTAKQEQDALFGTDGDESASKDKKQATGAAGAVDILDTGRWADETKPKAAALSVPEVDLMAFANSSSPSSPAVIRKQSAAANSGSDDDSSEEESDDEDDEDDEDESSDDEENDKPSKQSKPELSRPDTLSTTLDFFSATSTSPTSKSNGPLSTSSATKQAPSPSNKSSSASSTFDILSGFPASPTSASKSKDANGTPIERPAADRATSGDPLMHHKAVAVPVGHPPAQPLFSLPSSSQTADESAGVAAAMDSSSTGAPDYNTEIVTKLFPLPKPRQPPVRLVTLQLMSSLLRELVFDPTSTRASLLPNHLQLLRDTNRSFSDDLKLRFKNVQQGNFLLDVVDDEWAALKLNLFPKALVQNTRNLLTIEDKQLPGVPLEWRRGGNEWEKSRKSLQGYLLCRMLRYQLTKAKDPFYPLAGATASSVKVGGEMSTAGLVFVLVSLSHPVAAKANSQLLLVIDADHLLLLSRPADAPAADKAKVELIVPLKQQEPFAAKVKRRSGERAVASWNEAASVSA